MTIDDTPGEDVTVLAVRGELDGFELPQLAARMDALIERDGARLVLNLRGLAFASSSVLAYLIRISRRVRASGGEVVFSELSSTLATNFRTLGLDQILKTFPNDTAAVQYLREVHGGGTGPPGAAVLHFHLAGVPEHTAIGKVHAVYDEGLTFTYPADFDRAKIDPDALQIGRQLRIRLRQPVPGPARFVETQAEIVMAVGLDDGTTKYRLRCASTNGADRDRWATLVREWQRLER